MQGPTVVDVGPYLADKSSQAAKDACAQVAQSLKTTSCLIIRDPRVNNAHNDTFLNMLERYFEQPDGLKLKDVRAELSYQLGATPELVEVPRDHTDQIKKLSPENAAHIPKGADLKWRYFWRVGDRPESTKFPELNAPPVIPEAFPEWTDVMNQWGKLMLASVETVAEMTAVGLGLPANAFTDLMRHGPHLLAPTGSDLAKYGQLDAIFAGYHYDLNFLTIHGRSRFPGLYIWLRDNTRCLVRVPDGCLLIQAGKQLEWLTAGAVTAGFHEVVVTPETLAAVQKAKDEKRSLWRVSSTLFSHIASDKTLAPLAPFKSPAALAEYPEILAGEQVQKELDLIALGVGGQQQQQQQQQPQQK
jgi:isopenicillin N synthase-like dioxygenase